MYTPIRKSTFELQMGVLLAPIGQLHELCGLVLRRKNWVTLTELVAAQRLFILAAYGHDNTMETTSVLRNQSPQIGEKTY